MSATTSPSTNKVYGLKRVCETWKVPRSTVYSKRSCDNQGRKKPGPKPKHTDDVVLLSIREDLKQSSFKGEGHRKVHARLRRRKGVVVGRQRILRLMKENGLLSPNRCDSSNKAKKHDGRITTDEPGIMWGTDATKVLTVEDGWVSFFGLIEHWNAECMGWTLVKRGDRFAAIEALKNAVKYGYGGLEHDIARGLKIRPDHGSQFTSKAFRAQTKHWGISLSYSFIKEPETNGVVERFHRTFKEQIIHGRIYRNLDELYAEVKMFIETYNEEWLLEKLNYQSPREARRTLGKFVGKAA